MRWRQVVGLWVVCGAMAGEYWLVERRQTPAPAADRGERRRFLQIDAADVQELALARTGRSIAARRTDGRWSVIEPPDAPVPPDLVAAFIDALSKTEEIEHVPPGAVDARAFGLDAGASRVELRGGSGPVIVTIGGPNPTGTAVYARRGEAPEVILIGRDVRYYEDLIFQALPSAPVPADTAPIGG